MADQKLSRALDPAEVPQEADESMPEARIVHRRPPDEKPRKAGAEDRSGDEHDEPSHTREVAPERDDPPKGQAPADWGGQ